MIEDKPPTDPWDTGTRSPNPPQRRRREPTPRAIWHWSVLDESQILLGAVVMIGAVVLLLSVRALLPASDGCRDPSCAIGQPIGVTWIEADDTLAARYLPCGDETVSEIRVTELRTGAVLWHLTSPDPTDRTTFIAGQPVDSYIEQVPLELLPVGKLELTLVGDHEYVLPFERSDLFGDFVFINGSRVTQAEFESEAIKVGGCADRQAPVEADNGLMLTTSLIALAGAAAAVLAIRFIDVGSERDR